MRKVIMVNVERCLGCKSCEIACAVAHSESRVLEQAIAEQPRPRRRMTVEVVGEYGVPLQCRHCEDAPCMLVCPTGAIHRPDADGPVLIEQDRCIGCRFCVMVCPFGVMDVSSDGKVALKCDLCIERVKAGLEPACVTACPTGALVMVEEKEMAAEKRRRAAKELVASSQKGSEQKEKREKTQ